MYHIIGSESTVMIKSENVTPDKNKNNWSWSFLTSFIYCLSFGVCSLLRGLFELVFKWDGMMNYNYIFKTYTMSQVSSVLVREESRARNSSSKSISKKQAQWTRSPKSWWNSTKSHRNPEMPSISSKEGWEELKKSMPVNSNKSTKPPSSKTKNWRNKSRK